MSDPVPFLDIDGVLSSREYIAACAGAFNTSDDITQLDPVACARLQPLLAQTGAAVVLSSSWRYGTSAAQMQALLHRRGVTAARVISPSYLHHRGRGLAHGRGVVRRPSRLARDVARVLSGDSDGLALTRLATEEP